MRALNVACLALLLPLTIARAAPPTKSKPPATVTVVHPTLAEIQHAQAQLKPLSAKLGPPRPNDWLAMHKEHGQSFEEFRRTHPARQPRSQRKIYIQPLGPFNAAGERLIESTSRLLGCVYDAKIQRLPVIAGLTIPDEARRKNPDTGQEQFLTTYVLDQVLIPELPQDATAVLALTATDLWPGKGWNFVFGQASTTQRVGVWSIARYGDPEASDEAYRLCLLRTLKVAMHETGHMLGFEHCTAYICDMNGSNSAPEMDRTPLAFCPECAAKVWWACQRRPTDWLSSLEKFAADEHLDDEEAFWKRSREALGK